MNGTRILLVEDDEDIGSELIQALTSHGYRARLARGGTEALSAAAAEPPDLVLLDLGPPDIDGVAVCRRLRAAAPDGIIVVLTARTGEFDVVCWPPCWQTSSTTCPPVDPFGGSVRLRQHNSPLRVASRWSPRVQMPRFWFSAACDDSQDRHALTAFRLLLRRHLPAVPAYLSGGGHTAAAWRAALPRMLEWMTPLLTRARRAPDRSRRSWVSPCPQAPRPGLSVRRPDAGRPEHTVPARAYVSSHICGTWPSNLLQSTMDTSGCARGKAVMHAKKKLSAVASLAAPILIGGAAGVAAAQLPVATAPADTVTAAAHTAGPSRSATASPGSATSGGHQNPPRVNVGHQSSDRE